MSLVVVRNFGNVDVVSETETRKKIFEEVLGLTQEDLAGITIGYKLKQQRDIDQLFEHEFFDLKKPKVKKLARYHARFGGLMISLHTD